MPESTQNSRPGNNTENLTPSADPRAEYSRRLETRRAAAARGEVWHRRFGNARLGIVILAAGLAWLAFQSKALSPWWLTLPAAAFLCIAMVHERVLRERGRLLRAAAHYERGLARLDDRWMGSGVPGDRFMEKHHRYAVDLDLFGKGSLFELLCTARTPVGEKTLASWLTAAAAPSEILLRQAAVEELRGRVQLREDLSVVGAEVASGLDHEFLAAWGSAPQDRVSAWLRLAAGLLAAAAVAGLIWWGVVGERLWFLLAAVVEGAFAMALRRRVRPIVEAVERAGRGLSLLSRLLSRLEEENFGSARLVELRRTLDAGGHPLSRQIAELDRLVALLDSGKNQFFTPIAAVLLWRTQIAFAIEAWRARSGRAVAGWLKAVGEIEALCALAGYAYEHPADPFPEIVLDGARFDGEGLGHPLLPTGRGVRNDVRLGGELRVLLVSGSNMSGKSTLLRTVGINAVLAQAGAPVRALRLRISALAPGASIRTVDSLQEGSSRFYAEITRLRQLVDLSGGPVPLLFLLDELLHGTNSHDRRIGAEAVVRGLVDRGAIGLLTTHDLALAEIVEILAPRASNMHFQDHIENGRIAFDYRLRPGVVLKSNALELMRSVGLEV